MYVSNEPSYLCQSNHGNIMELSIKISDLSNFSSNQTSRTLPNLKHLFVPAEGIQMLRSFALEAISQNPSEFGACQVPPPKKNTALTEAFGYERIQIFNPEGRLRDLVNKIPATQDAVMLGKDKLRANSLSLRSWVFGGKFECLQLGYLQLSSPNWAQHLFQEMQATKSQMVPVKTNFMHLQKLLRLQNGKLVDDCLYCHVIPKHLVFKTSVAKLFN